MSGPAPKPRDQRARRNKDEGTTSTTVELPADAPPLPAWIGARTVVTVDGAAFEVPRPPRHASKLRKAALRAWVAYWTSPEAAMIRPQHVPALERLVLLYDEEARLVDAIEATKLVPETIYLGLDGPAIEGEFVVDSETRMRKLPGRLGVGSTGQLVTAPEVGQLKAVRAEIRALEDRFAGSPMAQFKLGWQQAEMYNSQARAGAHAAAIAAAARELTQQFDELLDGTPS